MGLPEDTDEIVLRCSDDQTRTVQYAVAKMSGTIKNLVEGIFTMYCIIYPLITSLRPSVVSITCSCRADLDEITEVPLPNVTGEILDKVLNGR